MGSETAIGANGHLVKTAYGPAMPDIEVGIPAFAAEVVIILNRARRALSRAIVDRMAQGVGTDERQALGKALFDPTLQRIVLGTSRLLEQRDVAESQAVETSDVWPHPIDRLVDVAAAAGFQRVILDGRINEQHHPSLHSLYT